MLAPGHPSGCAAAGPAATAATAGVAVAAAQLPVLHDSKLRCEACCRSTGRPRPLTCLLCFFYYSSIKKGERQGKRCHAKTLKRKACEARSKLNTHHVPLRQSAEGIELGKGREVGGVTSDENE